MHAGHRRRVKFSLLTEQEAHYNFEEGSGATVGDSSGNSRDGTAYNSMTWPTGRVGTSAGGFASASTQYVGVPANNISGTADFSISFWIKTSTSVFAQIYGRFISSTYLLVDQASTDPDKIQLYVGEPSNIRLSSVNMADGLWHSITARRSGGTSLDIYTDGVLSNGAQTNPANNPSLVDTAGNIAKRFSDTAYLNGDLDDFRIHSRALSAPEIYELSIRDAFVPNPPAWTPADITTLAWYDATDATTITEAAGAVSQWDDKSGNARHVSQGTGSYQPIWDGSKVDFDGTNDHLDNSTPFMYDNGSIDVFVVGEGASLTNGQVFAAEGRSASNNPIYSPAQGGTSADRDELAVFLRNDALTTILSNSVITTSGPLVTTVDKLMQWRDTGTSVLAYVDGVIETTTGYSRSGVLTLDRFCLGALRRSGSSNWLNGSMREVVITGNLSTDDRQSMEGYLSWKHAGDGSYLPIGHPYKSAAP